MLRNCIRSLSAHFESPNRRRTRRPSQSRLSIEGLENRQLLTTLVVNIADPTANDPGDNLYAQIQEAVSAAEPGDHIKVHAGTYEPVTITTDNLTIREANEDSNPMIDANGGTFAVHIAGDNVTVRGMSAQNATNEDEASGFLVTGDFNTLTGNAAIGNHDGFTVDGGDNNRLVNNTANGNINGFVAAFSANNTFTNNIANDNEDGGFFDFASSENTYKGNSANGNGFSGFQSQSSAGTTLKANEAEDNFVGFFDVFSEGTILKANVANGNVIGIAVQFSEGTILTGNSANDNELDGFNLLASSGMTVIGNNAVNNGRDGFNLRFVENSNFTGNIAAHNDRNGFSVDAWLVEEDEEEIELGSTGNVFTGNEAQDNGDYGVFLHPASVDNVFQGIGCNGNGLGDSNDPGIC